MRSLHIPTLRQLSQDFPGAVFESWQTLQNGPECGSVASRDNLALSFFVDMLSIVPVSNPSGSLSDTTPLPALIRLLGKEVFAEKAALFGACDVMSAGKEGRNYSLGMA